MDRLMELIRKSIPLMTEDQQEQVVGASEQVGDLFEGPFGTWRLHLSRGWCRLPELTPEVGKELLLAWLSPEVDGGMVCRQCGLEYPKHRHPPISDWRVLPGKIPLQGPPPWYDLPEFFQTCPNCGASRFEMDWPHLMRDKYYLWMELDGFMRSCKQREKAPNGTA
jgi:hypothetical protein